MKLAPPQGCQTLDPISNFLILKSTSKSRSKKDVAALPFHFAVAVQCRACSRNTDKKTTYA